MWETRNTEANKKWMASGRGTGVVVIQCPPEHAELVPYLNAVLRGQLRFREPNHGETSDVTVSIGWTPPFIGGLAIRYGDTIQIDSSASQNIGGIVIHEMLHSAGFAHEDDPSSVMYFQAPELYDGRARQIFPRHVEALRRLGGRGEGRKAEL